MKPVERVGERFVLESEIGSGGMSTVYLGRDEVLDRPVAVKILRGSVEDFTHPGDIDLGDRFEREGRTAARLSHANIVQVYDAGKDFVGGSDGGDGRSISYIVMEYVPGGDLKGLIDKEGPLSGRRLTRLGAAVASGLSHAHERGIVHRDIKPQNVLIDEYGNPKLTDFGIARALDPDGSANVTRTGHYLGTALYSAPEQLNGEGATPKSDVYALGVTLYHAATGEPPFSGNPIEVATQQMNREPRPPNEIEAGSGIDPEVEKIILSCLVKDPESRPSAAEMQRSLYRAGLSLAGSSSGTPKKTGLLGAGPGIRGGEKGGSGDGGYAETASLSTRTFQGSRDRGPLIVGAVAVIFLIAVLLGGLTLLGGGDDEASNAGQVQGTSDSGDGTGGDEANGDGSVAGAAAGDPAATTEETTAQEETTEPEETTAEEETGTLPPTEEAGQLVFDYYVALAESRFDDAYSSLSSDYQDEVGGVGGLEEQESAVDGVFFDSGVPQAALEGREARVEFTVSETRAGTTQDVSGTWVAVSEDGEWRLDRLE